MLEIDIDSEGRASHPLDFVERMATLNNWQFEREAEDELSVHVAGGWSDYEVAVTWLEEMEALHIAAAFDLKVPDRRRNQVLSLISLINEQLWVGHFDLWSEEHVVMFRHSLLLSGGVDPNDEQVAALMKSAVDTCERYYQAFQFVLWAGRTAREALDMAMMETAGQA